ncbi:hypothetical protein [Alkalicoccus urumqiensis]|uniref:Uncharacterized protein n=1 Tax=Alkalicoccus urumqiensis TaxID=1548213 RepID=A0A2P6MII4_ALKUR|nr:hypothetical protein [Alkalicoccus urumqiensis]PRO66043.1 hypothetical protein C6I21_07000 [Alkalicoccus urumqiensis]
MFWFFLIMVVSLGFVIAMTGMLLTIGKKPQPDARGREVASDKTVEARSGTYKASLVQMPSPYENERCFRVELKKNGHLAHKNIAFFDAAESYTDVLKAFVKEFDRQQEIDSGRRSREEEQRIDLETWDGDVYEDNVTELPKRKSTT